ncbi:Glutamyl-tRNA(Gln) amidotransferase subunit A [Coccomyxa sp. Obi]|nr:Glutamyl-tRNA(Gln) amidotransferase subunit A [Coccomyxa sp. Obi]
MNKRQRALGDAQIPKDSPLQTRLLLGILLCSFIRAECADFSSTVADLVHTKSNLTTLDILLDHAGLRDNLRSSRDNYTLFAPHDAAWDAAFYKESLDCTADFYVTSPCSSIQDMLSATNLRQILLNHVVVGTFDSVALVGDSRLQFLGGAVQPVMASSDGTILVGSARVVSSNIPTKNGVVHIINNVLADDAAINSTAVAVAAKLGDFGPFNRTKREQMFTFEITFLPASLPSLATSYQRVRMAVGYPDGGVSNGMAVAFLPGAVMDAGDVSYSPENATASWSVPATPQLMRPSNDNLAFLTIPELGALLRSKAITSMELTQLYLQRLRRYDPYLEFVVTYTEDLAYSQAARADRMFSEGVDLGPLQGIPYGLKDLIAVEGYRTTWGAPAYMDQVLDTSANVYKRLQKAGAVLVAKLATGEMAFDDVWWGGKVKNPWNLDEGSSGSSAGPAAAVVAGAVAFAVGTETEGSLMAPAERTGATALRPTFGLIGRSGVMSLVDSLDKMGPFCRAASDCALILDILRGRDTDDIASQDVPLPSPFNVDVSNLSIGVLPSMQDSSAEFTAILASKGVTVKPFELNYTTPANDIILTVMASEAAANFDYWQRSGRDDTNRRQDFWPPLLRLARMIPAVEYIQAQRARTMLVKEVLDIMQAAGIDAFIGNTSEELAMANLVSLPTMALPIGFAQLPNVQNSSRRHPLSLGIFGAPYTDANVLALGMAFQQSTSYHLQQPPVNRVEPAILAKCMPYSRCGLPRTILAALSNPGNSTAPPPVVAQSSKAASSG